MKKSSKSQKEREKEDKQEIENFRKFEEEIGYFDRIILATLPIILFILFCFILFKIIYNYLGK